jgi:nitroreductase
MILPGGIELPRDERDSDRPFHDVLARRRTTRTFAARPVSLDELAAVLTSADVGKRSEAEGIEPFQLLVIVRHVEGLRPGVYVWCADERELRPLSGEIATPDVAQLYVQPELGEAPVHVWITASLEVVTKDHGARGYRWLLFMAGALAQRLFVAAVRADLGAAIVAGLVQGAARVQLGLDGYRNWAALAVLVGHSDDHEPAH